MARCFAALLEPYWYLLIKWCRAFPQWNVPIKRCRPPTAALPPAGPLTIRSRATVNLIPTKGKGAVYPRAFPPKFFIACGRYLGTGGRAVRPPPCRGCSSPSPHPGDGVQPPEAHLGVGSGPGQSNPLEGDYNPHPYQGKGTVYPLAAPPNFFFSLWTRIIRGTNNSSVSQRVGDNLIK